MPIIVKFLLSINSHSYDSIASKLKTLDLDVLSLEEYQHRNPDPNSLICKKTYGDVDAIKALDTINSINHMDGVNKITPLYNVEKEKQPRHKHPLIPVAISTTLTFFTLAAAVYGLKINVTSTDYFYIMGVPTIITFLSQPLYKFY
jgi:hypothetical protein